MLTFAALNTCAPATSVLNNCSIHTLTVRAICFRVQVLPADEILRERRSDAVTHVDEVR